MRTPGVFPGVSILVVDMITGCSLYANDVTDGSTIFSSVSRVPSSFVVPISCPSSTVGISRRSNSSCNLSAPECIG